MGNASALGRVACSRDCSRDLHNGMSPTTLLHVIATSLSRLVYFCPGATCQAPGRSTALKIIAWGHEKQINNFQVCSVLRSEAEEVGRGVMDGKVEKASRRGAIGGERPAHKHKLLTQGPTQQKRLSMSQSTRYQEVTQTGGKTCTKASGFGRDRMGPPNTGKCFQKLLSLHYQ